MAENDLKIKDASLVETISGSIKMPASNGSGLAKSVSVEQILEEPKSKVVQAEQRINTLNTNVNAEIERATKADNDLASDVADFADNVNKEAERATKADQDNALAIDTVKEMIWSMSAETYSVGFARENGSADPDAEFTFGTDEMYDKITSHIRMGVVKNGVVQKTCKRGYLTVAEDGSEIAIDGSMGDVMLFTDCKFYKFCETMMIGGREMNVIAIGLSPFSYYDRKAKEIDCFALTPDGTVNCKIFDDIRSQAHCVYNTEAKGTYTTPVAIFKDVYKKSGGGYPTQYVSCIDSIKQAQNKNESDLSNRPYMSGYYEFFEVIIGLMLARMKSTNHTNLTDFGVGSTAYSVKESTFNDIDMSGDAGMKIIASDDSVSYVSLISRPFKLNTNSNTSSLLDAISGSQRDNFISILEAQRLLDGIIKNGLIDYIGNSSNIFIMDDNGNVSVITNNSVNLSDGTGMNSTQHYYIVRSVPNFKSITDGYMTAVINSYTKFDFSDDVVNTNNIDLTGCIGILKRSIPLFMGWALPIHGYYIQMDGAFYITTNDNGEFSSKFCSSSNVEYICPRTSFDYKVDINSESDMDKGLDKRLSIQYGIYGWVKKANYSSSLFCYTSVGGSNHTYESSRSFIGRIRETVDKRTIRCSALGCSVAFAESSARTLFTNSDASVGYVDYVGSFSVPHLKFK